MVAGAVLASALALVAVVHQRRATGSSCAPIKTIHLKLERVTADGVPMSGSYDAKVVLFNRGPGAVEISARRDGETPFYNEVYRAPAAPAP
jgi:hypothetical protein